MKTKTKDKAKTIEQEIKDAFDTLTSIHATLAVRMLIEHPQHKVAEVNDLQHRLEFRIKQHELNLLRDKIAIYGEVLEILKP